MVKALLFQTKGDWNLSKNIGCLAQSKVQVHCSSLSEQPQGNFSCSADRRYCTVTFVRHTGDSCCTVWLRSHLSARATETAELSTGDWCHGALSCSGDFMKIHGQGCNLIWSREGFVTKKAGDKHFSHQTDRKGRLHQKYGRTDVPFALCAKQRLKRSLPFHCSAKAWSCHGAGRHDSPVMQD